MIDQIILESEGLATLNKFSWKANEVLNYLDLVIRPIEGNIEGGNFLGTLVVW